MATRWENASEVIQKINPEQVILLINVNSLAQIWFNNTFNAYLRLNSCCEGGI